MAVSKTIQVIEWKTNLIFDIIVIIFFEFCRITHSGSTIKVILYSLFAYLYLWFFWMCFLLVIIRKWWEHNFNLKRFCATKVSDSQKLTWIFFLNSSNVLKNYKMLLTL